MKIVPCVELPLQYDMQRLAEDLAAWAPYADYAIVATQIGIEPFKILKDANLPIRILPGVKVNQYLCGRMDNVDGWRLASKAAQEYLSFLDESRYWIECETTMYPIWNGTYKPNHLQMSRGLQLMPPGVIWYPGVAGYGDGLLYAQQVGTVIESSIEGAAFNSVTWSDRTLPSDPDAQIWQHWHDSIAAPQIPICIFETNQPWYWRPAELPGLMASIESHISTPPITEMMWYPGSTAFHDQTKACLAVLDQPAQHKEISFSNFKKVPMEIQNA